MSHERRRSTPGSYLFAGIGVMLVAGIFRAAGDISSQTQLVLTETGFAVGFLIAAIGAIAIGVELGNRNSRE